MHVAVADRTASTATPVVGCRSSWDATYHSQALVDAFGYTDRTKGMAGQASFTLGGY